jgi:hypothetical protein
MNQLFFNVRSKDDVDLVLSECKPNPNIRCVNIDPCKFKTIFDSNWNFGTQWTPNQIIIHISPKVKDTDIQHINSVLKDYSSIPNQSSKINLKNVTIINELSDTLTARRIVFVLIGTDAFSKVENILPIYPHELRANENRITTRDMKLEEGVIYFKTLKVYNYDSHFLQDTWWYNYYNEVPQCARRRLVQFSGTCWFNSAFNSLVLTPYIRMLLINLYERLTDQYKKDITGMSLDSIYTTLPLDKKLWFMIYKMYIERVRLTSNVGNVSLQLAADLKKLTIAPHNAMKKYGEGGNPVDALKIIVKNTIPECITQFINTKYINQSELMCLGTKTQALLKEIGKLIQSELDKLNNEYSNAMDNKTTTQKSEACRIRSKLRYYREILPKYEKFALEYGSSQHLLVTINIKLSQLFDRCDGILKEKIKEFDSNIETIHGYLNISNRIPFTIGAGVFICFYIPFTLYDGIPTELQQDNKIYKLEAALLQCTYVNEETKQHHMHVVTGLRCNDEYYIYDSNNIIVKAKWHESLKKNYSDNQPDWIDEFRKKTEKPFVFRGCKYGIYILQHE